MCAKEFLDSNYNIAVSIFQVNCPKFYIFTNFVTFQVELEFFNQLLQPYEFPGNTSMKGILFFSFARSELLTIIVLDIF